MKEEKVTLNDKYHKTNPPTLLKSDELGKQNSNKKIDKEIDDSLKGIGKKKYPKKKKSYYV